MCTREQKFTAAGANNICEETRKKIERNFKQFDNFKREEVLKMCVASPSSDSVVVPFKPLQCNAHRSAGILPSFWLRQIAFAQQDLWLQLKTSSFFFSSPCQKPLKCI